MAPTKATKKAAKKAVEEPKAEKRGEEASSFPKWAELAATEEFDNVKVAKAKVLEGCKVVAEIVQKRNAENNALFEDNMEFVTLNFTIAHIPEKRRPWPDYIEVPHPFHGKSEVCIFTDGPQKEYKEMLMEKHPHPQLKKVISIEKLRKNYSSVQQRRDLCNAFEVFLCQRNVIEHMPNCLGRYFLDVKKKMPFPIKLGPKDTAPHEKIQKILNCATMRIPTGNCIGVRIGRAHQSAQELAENAMEVIKFVSGFWAAHSNSVTSIHVSSIDTPSLPLYQRPPCMVVKPAEAKPLASAPAAPESSDEEEEVKADAPARTQVVEVKEDKKGSKRAAPEAAEEQAKKKGKNRVKASKEERAENLEKKKAKKA